MAFDIKKVGGLGTGALGDVTISSSSTQVNSYANVIGIGASGYQLTIGTPSIGNYGGFTVGQEIMFHSTGCKSTETTNLGVYGFATILAVSGSTVTLDKAIPIVDLAKYVCQVVTVPNFNNLTVNCTVCALSYNAGYGYGGIIIAKATGKLDIASGSLITADRGLPIGSLRQNLTFSNADLANKFVMSQGNGMVITIANSLNLSSTSRLGGFWSGALGVGIGYTRSAGYSEGYSGHDGTASQGGNCNWNTGGGLKGFRGSYGGSSYGTAQGGAGGACILILANTITNFDLACFSTGGGPGVNDDRATLRGTNPTPGGAGYGGGGGGGEANYCTGSSGGGPGFGYIATNAVGFSTNTIAYALDTLLVDKSGLLISNTAMDCTALTSIDGFAVDGQQPSGTNRRVIFSTNATGVLGSRTYPITTNAVAADTVTIGGVTFTAIASGATGNQFNVGATIAATATNIASTLNANATINVLYAASADANGVVTLTEKVAKGNTPAAATKTGTIVIGAGTAITSVPKWYKLTIASGAATLSAVATQTPTISSVLAEGNTVDELLTVTSVASFIGKLVYPAIALMAPYDSTVFPTLKLSLKGHSNQDVYAKVEYSPEFTLSSEDVEIINTSAAVTLSGSATGIVEISLKQAGVWSAWMPMASAKRQKASAVKYKATLSVTTIGGVDSASVGAVTVQYRSNNAAVSGGFAEIITDTETFGENMHFARVTVKHKPLKDATIKAYASMRNAPKILPRTLLGTGDGTRKTFTTGVTNLDPESIKVYWGASPCYDYDYNTGTGEISCTAPDGVAVLAECEYDWEPENWQPMTQSDRLNNASGLVSTGFTYALPLADPGKGISAVKVVLEKVEGTVTGDSLGTANGKTQLYVLDHAAKIDTISVRSKVGDTPVPNSWSYDPTSQILSVAATDQALLTINYDWVSETPVVYSLVASWSD